MKKIICTLLVAAMLLSFVPAVSLQAAAAEPTSQVGLTIGQLMPGAAAAADPEVVVENGGSLIEAYWGLDSDHEDDPNVFQENEYYYITVRIAAPEGATYTDSVDFDVYGDWQEYSYSIEENGSELILWLLVKASWNSVEWIELSELPAEIVPGTAQVPAVEVLQGEASVTKVRWVDGNKQAVTKFVDGKLYLLEVTLKPDAGYQLDYWTRVEANAAWESESYSSDGGMVIYFRYSLMPAVEKVSVTMNQAAEGMAFSALTATVTGNASLKSINVYDADYNLLETGTFQPDSNYRIEYVLQAKSGYEFTHGDTVLELNGERFDEWNRYGEELYFEIYFTTCEEIKDIEMTMTEVAPGVKIQDVELTVPADANYTLDYYYFEDAEGNELEEDEVFQEGHSYRLRYSFDPKEGYVFSQDIQATINGEYASIWTYDDPTYCNGSKQFSFVVDYIWLEGLPAEIEAGNAMLPELWDGEDQVEITGVKWVDQAKQQVTGFRDGEVYYLAVEMKPQGTRKFNGNPGIETGYEDLEVAFEVVNDQKAVAYVRYSLEPSVGTINITISGLEEGKNIQDVVATVTGNATLSHIVIAKSVYHAEYDYYDYEEVESGKFEANSNYRISYVLKANSGYRFASDFMVIVNGQLTNSYGYSDQELDGSTYFSTCQKISKVELTVTKPTVGKKFSDLKVSVPKNANYTVVARWIDMTDGWEEATGKVQKGHKYELSIDLYSKEGYVFSQNLTATLNGQSQEVIVGEVGDNAWGYAYYSFCDPITKVELPAMPTGIKKGDKLPVATVASSKNYTLTAYWNMMDADFVEKADNDGIYLLVYMVTPKSGYEFTDDTKFYVGGKEMRPVEVGTGAAMFVRNYNIGIEEITKIELNYEEPMADQPCPEVTTSAGVSYSLEGVDWAQSKVDDWYYIEDVSTKLEQGLYTYFYVMLEAEAGKALANNATFYLNGKKVEPTVNYCFGTYSIVLFSLGKLGEIEKLIAPALAVDGTVLSWNAVLNATGYEIYRATSKSGKYSLVDIVEDTTWIDDVTAGKTYYYKVKAVYNVDASKNSGFSGVVSIAYKCEAPVITVVNGSTGKPVISWEKVGGAKKYTVYRATAVDGKYTKLGTSTKLTYTDSKAKAGTEYYYKVIANASSSTYNSGYSNICMCYVICGTPSVTVKVDAATGKPSLSWKKVDGAVTYSIQRQLPGGEFVEIAKQTAVTFRDDTAPVDTVCQYRVQAIGQHEMLNGAYSKVVSATSGLAKPKLNSGVNSEGYPRFDWQPVEGAVKYEIYRSTKSTKGYTLIYTVEDGNAYADAAATPGKTFYYKVKAVGAISSAESAYVKLTGKCAAPWISIALHETSGKPVISWEKISGAKQYTVYRATSEEGKYTKLGTTKSLSYTDSKAVPGTEYYYKVIANGSKSSYNSNYSNVKFAVGYAAQPQVTLKNDSKGKPVVSWKKISEAEKYIVVYVDVTELESESQLTEEYIESNMQYVEVSKKKTSTTLSQAVTGRIYMVCVVAIPKNEEFFAISMPDYVAATCATPKISGKYIQGYNSGVWKAVEGAEYYAIYRSTKASGEYELLGYIDNDSSFVDLSAVKGKTYYYKVTACTEYTESEFSNYIKLKTK